MTPVRILSRRISRTGREYWLVHPSGRRIVRRPFTTYADAYRAREIIARETGPPATAPPGSPERRRG